LWPAGGPPKILKTPPFFTRGRESSITCGSLKDVITTSAPSPTGQFHDCFQGILAMGVDDRICPQVFGELLAANFLLDDKNLGSTPFSQ